MRKQYTDIGSLEKTVLQDQYELSPFHLQQKENLKPTRLDIFDFDSTLFLSPSLSPTIWHPSLIRELVGEDVYGPGWWKDYRSLDLGPIESLERSMWSGYWNEDIVAEARKSLENPTIMTVLLTGRRHIPFYPLISRMLASKDLSFDLLGLRPDPTQEMHDAHVNYDNQKCDNIDNSITAYGAGSVFANTLDFKTGFILNILHNVPSIKSITMWDDRSPHVKKFQGFLNTLVSQGLITSGSAIHVVPVRPRYRPKWERRVVDHVLCSHKANELLYQEERLWNRKVSSIAWNDQQLSDDEDNDNGNDMHMLDHSPHHHHHHQHHHQDHHQDHHRSRQHHDHDHHHQQQLQTQTQQHAPSVETLTKVAKQLSLVKVPSATVIRLSTESVETLQKIFEPYYHDYLKKHNKTLKGWQAAAETPLWFGQHIVLSHKVLSETMLKRLYGGIGTNVQVVIRSISTPDPDHGMAALVDIYPIASEPSQGELKKPRKYVLPLMHKPSEVNTILRWKFNWLRHTQRAPVCIGQVSYAYLLGLDGTVKNNEEHQLLRLDPETKSNVLGKHTNASPDEEDTLAHKRRMSSLDEATAERHL